MSDGIFDPNVSLDGIKNAGNIVKEVIKPTEVSDFTISNIIDDKEYWVLGLIVLFIIGYYTYDLVLKNNESFNKLLSKSKPPHVSNKPKTKSK